MAGNDFAGAGLICSSVGGWLEVDGKLEWIRCWYGCLGVCQVARASRLSSSGESVCRFFRPAIIPWLVAVVFVLPAIGS